MCIFNKAVQLKTQSWTSDASLLLSAVSAGAAVAATDSVAADKYMVKQYQPEDV